MTLRAINSTNEYRSYICGLILVGALTDYAVPLVVVSEHGFFGWVSLKIFMKTIDFMYLKNSFLFSEQV